MANGKNTRQENVRDDIKRSLEEADTRDVFDKVFDAYTESPFRSAAVGAIAGAVGGKLYGKARKSLGKKEFDPRTQNPPAQTGAAYGILGGYAPSLVLSAGRQAEMARKQPDKRRN
jgi:hypothetical protein